MTGEEATARGYRRTSNKYRLVSRIDRADWLEVLASRLRRAPADFYVLGEAHADAGWCDHYRRVYSNDKAILTPEEFAKVPASGGDATGYVPAPGEASPPVSGHVVVRLDPQPDLLPPGDYRASVQRVTVAPNGDLIIGARLEGRVEPKP